MPMPSRLSRVCVSALMALAVGAVAACSGGGGDCGPGDAPADGITLTSGTASQTFGGFHSSANNDCPPSGGNGPTSLTVEGHQVDPAVANRFLTLCLPRPDQIGGDPIALDDDSLVQVIDVMAQDDGGCRYDLDRTGQLGSATVALAGFCSDGTDAAGYALSLSGRLPMTRTCGSAGAEPVTMTLAGTVAVTADQL